MSSTQRLLNLSELEAEPPILTEYDQKQGLLKQKIQLGEIDTIIDDKQNVFPSEGRVKFQNVKMRYREGLSLVLNGLTFEIQPGMRVGCVGRTGAGKSSIISALFRLNEIENSTSNEDISISIDGHNTKYLGIHTLRGGISMIPQNPFIFSGSILRNLDPLSEFSKEDIQNVIEDVNLKEKIDSLPNGINTDMTNASEIFSVGQKQLICLGRAILKRSKLVIMDEATANVDMHTDELIQKKIKERFSNSTVITVAHRLNTIADYDSIIVLDKGSVIEQGPPFILLNNPQGIFAAMVNHTGQKNAQTIYQIAQKAYENKH